jgi:hypothetical protein
MTHLPFDTIAAIAPFALVVMFVVTCVARPSHKLRLTIGNNYKTDWPSLGIRRESLIQKSFDAIQATGQLAALYSTDGSRGTGRSIVEDAQIGDSREFGATPAQQTIRTSQEVIRARTFD